MSEKKYLTKLCILKIDPQKSTDVAVVIVTYNSEDEIAECLQSVYAECKCVSQQVVVVDNESSDNTVEIIREQFPQVKLVQPGENLGFAKGVNLGVRESDAEYVLLLNPDTVIKDGAIDTIVQFARKNPSYGLYGGRTLKPDGSLEPSSCWGAPSLWSLFLFAFGVTTFFPKNGFLDPESLGSWQRDTVREVGVITGCFLLSRRKIWDELEGLDETYWMYGEDADLAMRARKLGYRPVICPDAELIHEVGKSSDTPVAKTLLLYRGKASLVRKQFTGIRRKAGLMLLAGGTGLRAFLTKVKNGDAAERWQTLWRERRNWLQGYQSA